MASKAKNQAPVADAENVLPEVVNMGARFITSGVECNFMMAADIERVKSLRAMSAA